MSETTNKVVPLAERTIPVHKKDHEGVLLINALTGAVQQPIDERPEWADGHACALLNERHEFYRKRLGSRYADKHRQPEALAYEDLGWIAVSEDEDGHEYEISADDEFRMEILAGVVGLDREEGEFTGKHLAEAELTFDRTREPGEVAALERAQEQGFDRVQKDGTNG